MASILVVDISYCGVCLDGWLIGYDVFIWVAFVDGGCKVSYV